jgi:hypothetical protein
MAKHGFRVLDSDLHVIEPRNLWEDSRGRRRTP